MHEIHLLRDLAVVMVAAAAMTLISRRFKQPLVLGYLLAGLLIGPYTPPFSFITNLQSIQTLAELGLVLLMFSLGLEFNLPKLRRVGPSASLAAIIEVVGMIGLGYVVGRGLGWNATDSLFLGAILSISSTTIIAKVFMELHLTKENFAQLVFGILILEDVAAVLILSVLSGFGPGESERMAFVLSSAGRIVLFIALFIIFGLAAVPAVLRRAMSFESKEIMGILALGLCFSGALLAERFHFSVALGAFLMGAVIAASEDAEKIEHWIHPVRDMFSAIFFVSAGMLIDPRMLWQYKFPILIITALTVIGKVATCSFGALLSGAEIKSSFKTGFSLAQIGEFSFVIATLGATLKLTSDFIYPVAVAVSSLTTFLTPYLIRHSDAIVTRMLGVAPSSVKNLLSGYHEWARGLKSNRPASPGTLIFSKYLIRLGMYAAVYAGYILLLRTIFFRWVSDDMTASVFVTTTLWVLPGLIALPLTLAISQYVNHVLLLLTTLALVSSKGKFLRRLNIHSFYNLFNGLTVVGLIVLQLKTAAPWPIPSPQLILWAAVLFLSAVFLKRPLKAVKESIESVFDLVLGLATSEPTRQAALKVSSGALIGETVDEVLLTEGAKGVNESIKNLKVREETGASIIAIYRSGQHIANPSPLTVLLPNDIIMVMGSKEERDRAVRLLV